VYHFVASPIRLLAFNAAVVRPFAPVRGKRDGSGECLAENDGRLNPPRRTHVQRLVATRPQFMQVLVPAAIAEA